MNRERCRRQNHSMCIDSPQFRLKYNCDLDTNRWLARRKPGIVGMLCRIVQIEVERCYRRKKTPARFAPDKRYRNMSTLFRRRLYTGDRGLRHHRIALLDWFAVCRRHIYRLQRIQIGPMRCNIDKFDHRRPHIERHWPDHRRILRRRRLE